MTIKEIEDKIVATKEKIAKIENTLNKHIMQRDKKIIALNKIFEEHDLKVTYDELKDVKGWIRNYDKQPYFNDIYWVYYDITNKDEAIESNTEKLELAKKQLKNLEEKLKSEKLKMQYLEESVPQVIKDFLLDWKMEIYNYTVNLKDEYIIDKDKLNESINKLCYEYLVSNIDRYTYLDLTDYNPEEFYLNALRTKDYYEFNYNSKIEKLKSEFSNKYSFSIFKAYKAKHWDNDWLDKTLTKEMNTRLLELMNRVGKITGKIIDADLCVNLGDLNGIIYGEDGNAKVNTIGAGGYAIQRFHYRVLVKEIKA